MSDPPPHMGLLGDDTQDQCEATAVGGWDRLTPLPLNKTRENQNKDEKFIRPTGVSNRAKRCSVSGCVQFIQTRLKYTPCKASM